MSKALFDKLDGIEANATADQTNAEIRAAVEAATDSNVFTDADHTKLDGIAASANNYTLPEATSTTKGGIELFSDTDQAIAANSVTATTGRTYGIQLNSAGQAVVNVPWTDTQQSTDVSLNAAVTDVFSISTQEISAVDNGSDAIVGWDDTESKLTYLSAADVRTVLNVEDGATADQTKADIDGLAITTVGALNSGSITSGFGNINNGSSTITTTGLISGGSLDIDDVVIDGSNIGHTNDTDLITLANGVVTVLGEISATTLDINGTNITATAAEINTICDPDTTIGTRTVDGDDGIPHHDGDGVYVTDVDKFDDYFSATTKTLTNKTLTSPDINTPDIDGGTIDGS